MSSDVSAPPPPAGPARRPHYTPDGAWFWTGATWIPAADVLLPRAAPGPPAPVALPSGPRWRIWLSAAVAAVLVAVVTAGVLMSRPAGQPGPTPPADRIFALPFTHHVGSVGMRGTLTGEGVTEGVNGVVAFTPDRALHVTLNVGGAYVGEYLDIDGIDYQTQEPGGPWDAGTPVSLIDRALGWAGGPPPPGLRVVGHQQVAGEPAWHLVSPSGRGWWIGAQTGHPLRFAVRNQQWALDVTFRGFGAQPAIMAPPQSNVSTLPIQGAVGTIISAPQMSMEVDAVQPAPAMLGSPPNGYRYQAIDLSYRNDGQEPVTFDNAFTLTGDHGAQYEQSPNVQMAPILPHDELLQPGQTVSGWDIFVVSRDARDLTLRVGPQADEQNVDFLVSIPLS